MKKLALLFIAVVAVVTLSACRVEKIDNDQARKSYTLKLRDFNSIMNYSSCDIHYTQSNTYKVVLKASPHWYETHSVTVNNGQLVIGDRPERKQPGITVLRSHSENQTPELWVSAPTLTRLTAAGSGDFYAETDITGQSLELTVAGSGDSRLKKVSLSDGFVYKVAGSGDIVTGSVQARTVSFRISGSGDVKSRLFRVENTELFISGSGDGDLSFDECVRANVSVSGSGDISLSGNLQSLNKRASGAGEVNTSNLKVGNYVTPKEY